MHARASLQYAPCMIKFCGYGSQKETKEITYKLKEFPGIGDILYFHGMRGNK